MKNYTNTLKLMPGFNEVSQFSTTILLKYEINDEVVSEIFSKFERGDF